MAVRGLSRCLVLFVIYTTTVCAVDLYVKENQPSGTYLGLVSDGSKFLDTLQPSQRAELRYKIFAKGNQWPDYFHVDNVTGEIRTAEVLDRETFCPVKTIECVVNLDIAVHSETFLRLVRVNIRVIDINDNWPEFPEPEITVHVPESAAINFSVPISGASDADTGENNGVQSYEILPADGPFGVKVVQNLDGTPELGIVVRRKLDREVTSSYQFQIRAKDGGSPPKIGTLTLNVLISDVNDHSPVFHGSPYSVNITEDIGAGSPVVHVTAADQDSGSNGEVKYQLSSRTLAKYPNLFAIDERSGWLRLESNVDFEDITDYRLVVEAFDSGTPSLTAQSLVIVNVLDVNDNSPVINFNFLSETKSAEILENAKLDEFIAHVSVFDKDQGTNSVVDCHTKSNGFKIERLYDNEFQVTLNSSLDREVSPTVNVTVICTDQGKPSLTQRRTFALKVLDINDNKPVFVQPTYTVTVSESLGTGETVIVVEAEDADSSTNGEVSYSLFGENREFFSIHEKSGVLSLLNSLDYETLAKLEVYVLASDGGVPQLKTSTAVDIIVTDVNDEVPTFERGEYIFKLWEESENGTFVGGVKARDPDTTFGGEVLYYIQEEYGAFRITHDGRIYTTQPIDRETYPDIHMTVVAEDAENRTQTSSVNVTVTVLDINDNRPSIVFPDSMNNTLVIPAGMQHRYLPFTTIISNDSDIGENSELVYRIENEEAKNVFRINAKNGSLWFMGSNGVTERQTHVVKISVRDHGTPPLTSISRLYVVVEPTGQVSADGLVNSNVLIVVVVVCITTIVSLLILVGIGCVRRSTAKMGRQGAITYTISPSVNRDDLDRQLPAEKSEQLSAENKNNLIRAEMNFFQTPEKHGECSVAGAAPDEDASKPEKLRVLDLSATPIDIFDLAQYGHKGIWLNYLRKNEAIPRTSSTNSRYAATSLSSMSLDTVTSDSGRGASEQDSRENLQPQHELSQAVFSDTARCSPDYMDMQRSPPVESTPRGEKIYYSSMAPQYELYLRNHGMIPVGTPRPGGQATDKGDNSNRQEHLSDLYCFQPIKTNGDVTETKCVAASGLDFRLPLEASRGQILSDHRVNKHTPDRTDLSPDHQKLSNTLSVDVSQKQCYRRQGSVSDSDEDGTTTSGSYTVDLRDFAEFEDSPVVTSEFCV